MATTKAAILIFVNNALKKGLAVADIEPEINTVLQKLSDRDLLIGSDDTNYPANTVTIDHPTGFRSEITLTPTSAAGVECDPLISLPGGYEQYRVLKSNDAIVGIPTAFASLNGKFYIWRPLNAAYDILIDFYKNHPLDPDNIEFGDEFTDAINSGVTYYKTRNLAMRTYMGDWKIEWFEALADRVQSFQREPNISKG